MKIALLVFIALFATKARSQTQHSIGPYTTSETERCVCRPHITVNPPVCSRSSPVNSSGTGYNCTTVQETLRTVLRNQETASSEAQGLRRQVDELQLSVSMLVELLHSRSKFYFFTVIITAFDHFQFVQLIYSFFFDTNEILYQL